MTQYALSPIWVINKYSKNALKKLEWIERQIHKVFELLTESRIVVQGVPQKIIPCFGGP